MGYDETIHAALRRRLRAARPTPTAPRSSTLLARFAEPIHRVHPALGTRGLAVITEGKALRLQRRNPRSRSMGPRLRQARHDLRGRERRHPARRKRRHRLERAPVHGRLQDPEGHRHRFPSHERRVSRPHPVAPLRGSCSRPHPRHPRRSVYDVETKKWVEVDNPGVVAWSRWRGRSRTDGPRADATCGSLHRAATPLPRSATNSAGQPFAPRSNASTISSVRRGFRACRWPRP